MEDLDRYNGDTEHDMWVDFTTHEYTGDLDEYFDDDESDGNLDDQY